MYSRQIDGQEPVEFGVSGKLWNGVLVMFDRGSDSLWTQLDGRAIQGERTGQKLEHVPSTFTTWSKWHAAHPDTLVLKKGAETRNQTGSRYAAYFDNPNQLYFPHLSEGLGDAVPPKTTVFGVVVPASGEALAVPESALLATPDLIAQTATGASIQFRRATDTGAVTAKAADGQALRVDRAFWYAWKRTHPESTVHAP